MSSRKANLWLGGVFLVGTFLILYTAAHLGPGRTAGIGVVAAASCGVFGWIIGAGIGVATAGVGMAASLPLAAGLAAMCGYAGPIAAALGFARPPVWAMPVFILGWCLASASIAVLVYRWFKSRQKNRAQPPGG